jgi:hypothetical protein
VISVMPREVKTLTGSGCSTEVESRSSTSGTCGPHAPSLAEASGSPGTCVFVASARSPDGARSRPPNSRPIEWMPSCRLYGVCQRSSCKKRQARCTKRAPRSTW